MKAKYRVFSAAGVKIFFALLMQKSDLDSTCILHRKFVCKLKLRCSSKGMLSRLYALHSGLG